MNLENSFLLSYMEEKGQPTAPFSTLYPYPPPQNMPHSTWSPLIGGYIQENEQFTVVLISQKH